MEQKESRQIRQMFGAIAPRYDRSNHLLSLSIDRYWRRLTCRSLAPLLPADPMILDLCAGTGDLTLQLAPLGTVVGCDFSHPMLVLGLDKSRARQSDGRVRFVEGDALRLPFPSGSFDAVTIAFGPEEFGGLSSRIVRDPSCSPSGRYSGNPGVLPASDSGL